MILATIGAIWGLSLIVTIVLARRALREQRDKDDAAAVAVNAEAATNVHALPDHDFAEETAVSTDADQRLGQLDAANAAALDSRDERYSDSDNNRP
jgi:hypothetical protein